METRQQSFHKQETWPVKLVSKTKFRRTRTSSADGKKGDENEGQSNPEDCAYDLLSLSLELPFKQAEKIGIPRFRRLLSSVDKPLWNPYRRTNSVGT